MARKADGLGQGSLARLYPASRNLAFGCPETWRDSRGKRVTRWPRQLLPSATVVILQDGCVVAHQRRDNHWWGLPGGRMEIGESLLACAIREAHEETGLHVTLDRLVSVDSDPDQYALVLYPDGNLIHYCNATFLARVTGGTLAVSEESLCVCWVSVDQLPTPFLPAHQWRLQQALRPPGEAVPVR